MGLSNKLSCEAGSFSHCCLNPHRYFQSEVSGFISLCWNPGLHGLSCFLVVPPDLSACECGTAAPPEAPLLRVLSAQLPSSAPPTDLDECFCLNSLVVRLPYSSIFCQFWLFFVFKLLLSFWLCEEAQCVYLSHHLGQKSPQILF